jgi:hypothetical protein
MWGLAQEVFGLQVGAKDVGLEALPPVLGVGGGELARGGEEASVGDEDINGPGLVDFLDEIGDIRFFTDVGLDTVEFGFGVRSRQLKGRIGLVWKTLSNGRGTSPCSLPSSLFPPTY